MAIPREDYLEKFKYSIINEKVMADERYTVQDIERAYEAVQKIKRVV